LAGLDAQESVAVTLGMGDVEQQLGAAVTVDVDGGEGPVALEGGFQPRGHAVRRAAATHDEGRRLHRAVRPPGLVLFVVRRRGLVGLRQDEDAIERAVAVEVEQADAIDLRALRAAAEGGGELAVVLPAVVEVGLEGGLQVRRPDGQAAAAGRLVHERAHPLAALALLAVPRRVILAGAGILSLPPADAPP
jgi:hypothetical protein